MLQPVKICGKCSSGGSVGQMLGCDMCDVWFHAACVDETDTNFNPDRTWKCSRCVKDDAGEVSGHHASKSVRSSASSRTRRELLLQQLEEQRALKLKQRAEEDEIRRKRAEEDEAFLQQKMELILDDDNESRRSKLSSRASRQKVEDWLNNGRGGQTVATGPAAAHLPECAPSTSGLQREVPTSTSTPQAGKTHKLVLVEDPRNGMPQHIGHLNYLGNSKGYIVGNSKLPPTSLVASNVGGQPFPLHASSQIAPVSELYENCNAKTANAETKVTFSGYIPPFVPSVHQNTFGVNCQGVGTCQGQAVKPPISRSTIIPPFVGASTTAPIVFPSVTVQNAKVSVLPSSTSVPNINAEQRASAVSAVESFDGTGAAELQPNPAGVQLFGGPQVGVSLQPAPSSAQLAARQVMPRDLPNFSGDPQDWPLFSSSFYNSTTACGFTDAENLARLQRCLTGHALDSVKSRLLMPESVPHVMETLRKLYGRPEVLIHTLLRRLRSVSSPRTENLQSVITFGMAVRNLVDHMFVAQLIDHLRNPMLLHELVEKLPSSMKMQWSWYKRSQAEVNLATFGEFMTEMVNTASDVTLPTIDDAVHQSRPNQAGKDNQKLYVHAQARGELALATSTAGGSNCATGPAETRRSCHYCSNEEHEVVTCPQFKSLDVDGRWKAMRSKGLCRTCLIPHRKWPCRSGKKCGVDGCQMRHHALLHSRGAMESSTGQVGLERRSGPSGTNVIQQNHHSALNFCLFRYLPVTLEGNGKQVETFAFLDDGCQTTLMEAGLAADLDIAGPAESLWLGWTGNISREEKGSQRLSVKISGGGMKNQYKLSNVRTVQKLQLQGQTFHYEELMKMYPHLRGLPLRSYVNAAPRIIIGIEHAQLLTALKVREGKPNDPVAVKTRLGWCVYGKQTSGDSSAIERVHLHTEEEQIGNRELHDLMKQYFAIEEAAVATPIESAEDSRARAILQKTTRRVEGGFETGLIWKYDHPVFPDSFPLALRRLQSLEKRLAKDQELGEKVMSLIRDYERKGYAHKITQEELESTDPSRVWYLPLGVVRNPKKPEKVRLIWDAAARIHRLSFNDMLLKGPDMMTSLVAVLLRFRQRSIAICGDIREMFHQVRIIAEDKQSQRFLFRYHPDEPPQIYVMDVATFGATCSPCSSQFVKNKNAQEFASQFPRASEAIIKAHYVDDYLDSVDTVEEAVQLVNEVKYVHALGGFEIRNFSSNSSAVLRSLGETERSPKSLDLEGSAYVERILGMVWKPAEDLFSFDVTVKDDLKNFLEGNTVPTKRQVLRLVMSLFDPCGFIAHYIVHGKILMQHIWRSGTDWDDGISPELQGMWRNWILLLERLAEVEVPRCLFGRTSSKVPACIQLHVFVDASELAYACCAYLRIVQAGVVHCCLVAAKTKVAPLKPLSIPRLELQACVIGCRLMETVCDTLDLPIEGRYLWTDSATALAWIKSDSRRYHPYVAFRVGEILNSTSVDEWFHVPSKQNVADDSTKWGSGPNFSPNSRWFAGESFLYEPMIKWPKQTELQWKTNEELRAAFHLHQELPKSTIDVSKFSNWSRLLRATAYVQRAAQNFRGRKIGGELTSDELLQAENLLWSQTQMQAYPDEYSVLKHNLEHPETTPKLLEKSSSLFQESPFMDSAGVIRMNSRISTAPSAPFATKYPVILPKDHALTRLLVDSYHRRFLHMHNETVLNEVRQRFRIPQLRPVIKRVARDCQRCRITKSVPQAPMMSPLPAVRLTPNVRAFSYTGVDYFGPIMVKQGRSLVKRWVALFTCLTIRAVHLEVVHSLSTQSCVMAIRRFVSRRGAPEAFYSDNGTCFKGASNLLADQLKEIHEGCAVTFTNARTTWHFNPPSAPHMGGCWERMVRSVKVAMAAVADHTHHPNDEVLETVVLEAESIVNSRPLTYIPVDDTNQEALTPNHFLLYGNQGVVQPRTAFSVEGATLRDSWKLTQYLSDLVWKRWVREYLPTLTRRTKWFQPTKPLEPGDVVFVVDENKRNGWLRGRIIEVVQGKDGQVRRAVVQTNDGILSRPAIKLALIDVRPNRKQQPDDRSSPELHGRGNVKEQQGSQVMSGQCFSPEVCCKTQSLISESTVLTNEGYVVRVPDNQYLPPEGQNTNTDIQTAPPPRPPTTPRPPPPTPTRYVPPPTTTRYVPPPTTTRYVPPPTTTRYVPPPTTTRYFPPPTTTSPPYRGDEYIPPREEIPASSNTDPNAVRPPQDTNEVPSPAQDTPSFLRPTQPPPPQRPFQPRPTQPPVGGNAPPPLPPVGCSAAMNCTEREFCSSTGVISKTPVVLTPEQELFRVPVTECRNPEKGFTGVCCRDPDYVDPWPVGMLGLYNPEILPFDDGSYKPNGNNGNGNQNGNSISQTQQTQRNEAILASPSRVTAAQNYGPNQITSASQNQYTKTQYDRGVTAAASSTSTTAVQRQQTQQTQTTSAGSTGTKRFTAGGLQFVHSGNTRFKPFQKQGGSQCAPRNYNTQPRGAGPWDTGFGEFPWQAMVILESNKTLLCGGAIISETTVVTAANCVYGLNPRDIMIKGGEWRLGVDAEPKTFQIVRVKNVIYHPAYQPTTLNYDVAMLVLEDRLRFDTHIGQLCLDENDVVPSASYENCVTTGWGREVLKIHIGNALMRQMPISLLSEADSQRELQNNGFTPESHICGRPAADACDVDIGSALACADTSGTYYLKGVYSSDNGCGRPDQIVSFSNIDVQWIRQALKNPNQFITPVPNYQTAANSPVASTVYQPSTLGPNYGKAYLPPY